jgi:hypothetical protein
VIKSSIALSVLFYLMVCSTGCSRDYVINISHTNLSDSYIHPYRVLVNGKAGFPTGLSGCTNGKGTASLSILHMKTPPEFITVEWLHILSNHYYQATIPLNAKTAGWLHEPPFRRATKGGLALIVQWRGEKKVAAMLVADFNDFSQGKMDLGEAVGEMMSAPENSPNYSVSYETLREEPGDGFLPGHVRRYNRTLDATLTREHRYGCPRRKNGLVNERRLPPAKLPFVYGENGEHIPCDTYSCSDKRELIEQLRPIERKRYPPGSTPPAMTFRDAPDPQPAW